MNDTAGRKLLLAGMVAALACRLPLAWRAPAALIRKAVSDDMFYYLLLAKNIATGNGATVDGETVSNGFHFLYAVLLVPLVRLSGGNADLLVHLALSLLTVVSVLCAWPLHALLRRRCSEACALFTCAVWLCSPFAVLIALSGVEAPVYVLVFGLLCVAYLRLKERDEPRAGPWFGCGLLAALAAYARLDGAVMAAVIAIELLVVLRRPKRAALFAGGAAVGFAPWLAWSYVRTGYFLQVSGKAIRYQQHLTFRLRGGAGAADWMRESLTQFRAGVSSVSVLNGVSYGLTLAACAIAIACIVIVAAARRELFRAWLRRTAPVLFVPVYGIVTLGLYSGWLWYSQNWYYYSVFFSACVAAALFIDLLGSPLARWPRTRRCVAWAPLFAALIVSFVLLGFSWWGQGLCWWQGGMYNAAVWCRENLPEGARLGSFNSGILGYYSGRTVVNLDGVVNPAAYEAMKKGRSYAYMKEAGVDYLVESYRSLIFRSNHSGIEFLGNLNKLHSERIHPRISIERDNVSVYEVR